MRDGDEDRNMDRDGDRDRVPPVPTRTPPDSSTGDGTPPTRACFNSNSNSYLFLPVLCAVCSAP